MTRPRNFALLIALGSAGLGACATKSDLQQVQADLSLFKAESGRRDSARAVQLNEVIRMQRAVFDSLQASNRAVGAISQAVTRIKGDLSTDLYNIQQQLYQLQQLTGQSQQRLSEIRTQLDASREAQTRPAPSPGDTAASGAGGAPPADQMYEASIAQLRRGSTATARAGLQELVRTHPTSERVPDALYFIGHSFASEQPDSAAAYYQRVADQYPKSSNAPAALYNLGSLLESRKDAAGAKRAYQRVVEQYPKSDEADLAREKLKKAPGR